MKCLHSRLPSLHVLLLILGFGSFSPHAEAGLEPVKTTRSGEADYVYYRYRNTTKHPITVQLRVHNNLFYDSRSKSWKTKSLKFPPFSLKPGEVKDGLTFMVPRGQRPQVDEVGSREDRGEERATAEASRAPGKKAAAAPQEPGLTDSRIDREMQKQIVGVWEAGPKEDPWNKNQTGRLEFRPNGTGTATYHTEFKSARFGGHWDHAFDFTYSYVGGGVWAAQFARFKTLSGEGTYGILAWPSMKKGTFTMSGGRTLRGSRTVEKNMGEFRKR